MIERTVLAKDVQSILRQNDKILDLNRKILDLMLSMKSPGMSTKSKIDPTDLMKNMKDIKSMKPGSFTKV